MANMIDGTSSNDNLIGTSDVDVFMGSEGNDVIDGGDAGYNQVDYDGDPSDYLFTQNADGTVSVRKPDGGVDTLSNIGGFWFRGAAVWKPLEDVLTDIATPPVAPTDKGTAGDDMIVGTADNDSFDATTGNDSYDGRAGNDGVQYLGTKSQYTLSQNIDGVISVIKPDGSRDTLKNIETVEFRDLDAIEVVFKGDIPVVAVSNNIIRGTDGDDYISGTDANDDILAGDGRDVINGSGGNDNIDGGGAEYDQVDYDGAPSDYTFTQNADGTVTVVKPNGGTDTLSNIDGFWFKGSGEWKPLDEVLSNTGGGQGQTINGTAGDDYLSGTSGDDVINAGAGRDVINGSKGSDEINGGDSGYNQVDYDGAPSDYTFTQNADGTVTVVKPNGGTDTLTDIGGFWFKGSGEWCSLEHVLNMDTPDTPPTDQHDGEIAGRYFCDVNGNQIDDGDDPVADTGVRLFDVDKNEFVASTTTDANGDYSFKGLPAGNYKVFFDPYPQAKGFVQANVGNNDMIDSDVTSVDSNGVGSTDVISLSAGGHVCDVDAGNYADKDPEPELGSLSGKYFHDDNRNDIDDDGANGQQGITVELLDASGNPTGRTTLTDADGNYSFGGLVAGSYGVKFTDTITGKTLVDPNVGNDDAIDSDAIRINDTMSEIRDIPVQAGKNTPDNDAGVEEVPSGPVLGSIGDYVWFDDNKDGLQDDNEDGVEGIIVKLKDGDGKVLDATITDENGFYLFDELEAGDYSVEFEDKDGFDFTERDAFGNFVDDRDSDADVNTGMTQTITLGEGEHRRDLDAGLIKEKVCIDFTTSVYGSTGNALIGTSNVIIQFKASDLPAGATLEHIDFGSVSNVWGNAQLPDYPKQNQHGESVWTISTRTMGSSDGGIFGAELVAKIKLPSGEIQEIHLCGDGEIEYFNIISPIALDLDDDGEIGVTGETTSKDKDADAEIGRTVEFDLDADGKLETIEWFDGSGDGILVDTSKIGSDGSIDGSALFGDEGGKYANGYEKLEAFDTNGDGMVSGDELEGLGLWIDDGDAVLEDGELQTAKEAGVSSISTDMKIVLDDEGRELMQSEAVVDGQTILTEDVWFAEGEQAQAEMEAEDLAPVSEEMNKEFGEDCLVA